MNDADVSDTESAPAQLDRRHLTCLVTLAEAGSLKAAAERLFVTPSAVASSLRQMERLSGLPLLERHGGAVRVGPEGWAVVDRARRALAALDEVVGARAEGRRTRAGTVQLMATPTTAQRTVPTLVGMLRSRNPGLFMRVIGPARAVVSDVAEAVLDGAADAAIAERPPRPVDGIDEILLERWQVHYVFPAGAGPLGAQASVREIVEHGLTVVPHFETSTVYSQLVRETQAIDGAIGVRSSFREHFADLALEGVAGFLCHHPQLPALHAVGLRTAPVEGQVRREIVALLRTAPGSPALADFLEVCRTFRAHQQI